jgi:Uma2 family endonuclease
MASALTLEPVSRARPEEALYEVVNGQRVELPPMGAYSTWIASELHNYLGPFAKGHGLGRVVVELLFILDAENDLRRRPDLAFVSVERWPLNRDIPLEGDWEVIPDLAVEVISPNDLFEEVISKVNEYFRLGVKQVWLVLPREKQVYTYSSPTTVRILTAGEELEGGNLLPGFRLPLAHLFHREADNGAPVG